MIFWNIHLTSDEKLCNVVMKTISDDLMIDTFL